MLLERLQQVVLAHHLVVSSNFKLISLFNPMKRKLKRWFYTIMWWHEGGDPCSAMYYMLALSLLLLLVLFSISRSTNSSLQEKGFAFVAKMREVVACFVFYNLLNLTSLLTLCLYLLQLLWIALFMVSLSSNKHCETLVEYAVSWTWRKHDPFHMLVICTILLLLL